MLTGRLQVGGFRDDRSRAIWKARLADCLWPTPEVVSPTGNDRNSLHCSSATLIVGKGRVWPSYEPRIRSSVIAGRAAHDIGLAVSCLPVHPTADTDSRPHKRPASASPAPA